MERDGPRKKRSIDTPKELRFWIAHLSPESPITDRFSEQRLALGRKKGAQQEQKNPWYFTQHEHWLGWLREQDGPGYYGRKNWNRSAEFVYNHINNPKMLIYLAEAAGIRKSVVHKAVRSALACRTMAAMTGTIRVLLPWPLVERALLDRRLSRSQAARLARIRKSA
jgi:hypothetical protein